MTTGPKTAPSSLKDVVEHLNAVEAEKTAAARTNLTPAQRRARAVARLAAVQALYQMELGGAGVDPVIREFLDHRLEGDIEGEALADADHEHFAAIVRGVVDDQRRLDRAIVARLAQGWKLERLDATVRAILRAGAWELAHQPDTPHEVVIDEYVELAKAFFDATEAKFVNAALDAVARDVRA